MIPTSNGGTMEELNKILANPIVSTSLKAVAPEIGLAIAVVQSIFGARHKPKLENLLSIIDKQLAAMIKELATTKSRPRQQELEIRIHTLLGIIIEWDK